MQRRELLARVAGVEVSDSTVSRTLRRMGFSRKKIAGSGGARRVLEGRLEGDGRWRSRDRSEAPRVLKDECGANISLVPLYAWSRRGERELAKALRNWGKNVTLLSSMSIEGIFSPAYSYDRMSPPRTSLSNNGKLARSGTFRSSISTAAPSAPLNNE
jgi:hypothetical protein